MVVAGPLTDAVGAREVFALSAAVRSRGAVVGFVFLRAAAPELAVRRRSSRLGQCAGRREWTRESLVAGVRDGDRRALARAISLVENGDPLAADVVSELYPSTRGGRTRSASPARRASASRA